MSTLGVVNLLFGAGVIFLLGGAFTMKISKSLHFISYMVVCHVFAARLPFIDKSEVLINLTFTLIVVPISLFLVVLLKLWLERAREFRP